MTQLDQKALQVNQQTGIVAGPILRKTCVDQIAIWLVTQRATQVEAQLFNQQKLLPSHTHQTSLAIGPQLTMHFLQIEPSEALPTDSWIGYDLVLQQQDGTSVSLAHEEPELRYADNATLGFIIHKKATKILHGSCRKPHFNNGDNTDGLALTDHLLSHTKPQQWPSLLALTGDQIYADDVAGPMLHAIHQFIECYQFPTEQLQNTKLDDTQNLHTNAPFYYQRDKLLPQTEATEKLQKQFFGGVEKPIFTSSTPQNHLMTLSEMLAMYLLVWSPKAWQHIHFTPPNSLDSEELTSLYQNEAKLLNHFIEKLPNVRRALAHLPSAMMFDDHDVTDDWNLTANWELSAYEHPMSRRIIGNALIAYSLCQGWGNQPQESQQDLFGNIEKALNNVGGDEHNQCIDTLLSYNQWHYEWPTEPPLIVLDTRTQRWRSEKNVNRPSGLMDWEALMDLQNRLLDHQSVILVSPAPIFGVKLIEAIQKIFTLFGKPLVVDAENWMAHPGSAHTLMNLFKHPKTPQNFVILSGDVHYSFVYDITVKGRKNSPDIWQITSSGQRNEFPPKLLDWFDRLNRWLYAPWSPLNLFTKRRGMWVSPRKPSNADKGERLLNHSGIGLVTLDDQGRPISIEQIIAADSAIQFEKTKQKQFE
ncbi:alkaline phosphatase D family protein [Marinomonas epiphytica]